MSDQKTATEHRRLAILRHLEKLAAHTSNTSILQDVLVGIGVGTNYDQLRAALAWLEEQELVELSGVGEFIIVTATRRGVEVATGQAVHPGVKRPSARG